MALKERFDWEKAKQRILTILKSDSPQEARRKKIELYLITLPFGINLKNFEFRYDSCGYPYWAAHKSNKTDSFKLREILDQEFDPVTFETEYFCPCCRMLL
jgi:hypothetical protein